MNHSVEARSPHGVRPAHSGDAPEIARIQREAFCRLFESMNLHHMLNAVPDEEQLTQRWRDILDAPPPQGCHTMVAIHGTALVGFVSCRPAAALDALPNHRPAIPEGSEMTSFYVDSRFQRSGHGSRMLSSIVDVSGASNVRIWVRNEDEALIRFLHSAGFQPAGVTQSYGQEDAKIVEYLWWTSIR